MSDKSYTNGEYIFREGESAAYAYVIKSGTVEIVKRSAQGVQVLAELTAPTIFGEMALIDGNPRSASLLWPGVERHATTCPTGIQWSDVTAAKTFSAGLFVQTLKRTFFKS